MDELELIRLPSQLHRVSARTAEIGFGLASEPRTGALLRVLIASKPGGRFLELGTGTGVAIAWLLDGMDTASELVSVDINPKVQQIARESFGDDPRLSLVTEDAASFLRRQPPASFDLVFADAMAGKYEHLQEALRVVRVGGFYVVDDMLPQPNWPEGHAPKVPILLRDYGDRVTSQGCRWPGPVALWCV